MSLFDKLKDTKLKSLKFGDKGTAGDSTKPYIVTDINTVDTPFNKLRLTKFDDGLIRGGAVGAINASAVDTLRIGKFLTDFPKGPLFIAKQVGLQLSNPPLETKQLPTNRVGKGLFGKVVAGISNIANKLNNLVGGPTRIYNLGINTLAQVPVNAFGGHINRHGFLPKLDESQKYIKVVDENNKNNNNRLERLYNNFFQSNSSGTTLRANIFKTVISDNFGGAKSVYGIGRTTIHRTTFTGRETDITAAITKVTFKTIQQGVSEHVYDPNTIYQKYKLQDPNANIDDFKQSKITASINISNQKTNYGFIPVGTEPTSSFTNRFKYDKNFNPINTYLNFDTTGKNNQNRYDTPEISPTEHIDALGFDNIVYQPNDVSDTALLIPQSRTQNATYNRLINQAIVAKIPTLKTTGEIVKKGQTKSISFTFNKLDDQGNKITSGVTNALKNIYERIDENIMRVEFSQLNPFTATPLAESIFSAYMSGYNENYDSGWDGIKYNGRSEFFYTFNSFKKTASFKLQIPIFNQGELAAKHEALKNLQKSAAGAYLNNRLGGVITKIKLGHYLNYAPCIITNLKITIPNDVSWDWGINNADGVNQAYAMLLEADFSITVIGNEIPGWDLGKTTPDTPPLPEDVVTPPKTNTLKIAIPPVQTVRTDETLTNSTPDTFGNRTYGGTSLATAAKSKEIVKDPVKQKALADALNKPKAVNK
jgi:hypothetical protein